MITAAAICPCPPLLIRELTGQEEVLPELRAACAAAVARLTASGADVIAVTGPAAQTADWPPTGSWTWAPTRPPSAAAASRSGRSGRPAAAAVAGDRRAPARRGRLRRAAGAGRASRRRRTPASACASAPGSRPPPRGWRCWPLGDGSARRSAAAPGYLDERAAPFDAAVERAVRDGDLAALAGLDPTSPPACWPRAAPAWQVLAGALGAADAAVPRTEILYSGAPLGVAYLVLSRAAARAGAPLA